MTPAFADVMSTASTALRGWLRWHLRDKWRACPWCVAYDERRYGPRYAYVRVGRRYVHRCFACDNCVCRQLVDPRAPLPTATVR